MSKINYIDLNQLQGCGLLFINTRDPLHQTFKAINKSPAPLVATWYQTNFDGNTVHDVVFIDPYLGLMRSSYLTNNLTIEELIISKPKKEWNKNDYEKVVDCIFSNYKRYFCCYKKTKHTKVNVYILLQDIRHDDILLPIAVQSKENIPKQLREIEFPLVQQHGDLWLYNIY